MILVYENYCVEIVENNPEAIKEAQRLLTETYINTKDQFKNLLQDEKITVYFDVDNPIKGYIKKELDIKKLDRQRHIRKLNNLLGESL